MRPWRLVLQRHKCPHCGERVGTFDRFCRKCGKEIGWFVL